jgi:hypothetical protein
MKIASRLRVPGKASHVSMHAHAIQYFVGNIADEQKPDKQKHGPENIGGFSKLKAKKRSILPATKRTRKDLCVV